MLKIAITGGIGSGKSYVAKKFMKLGIPVYFADKEAKKLMSYDPQLKQDIKAAFGHKVYHRNGRLNRAYLAGQIFNDNNLLKLINQLVHPAVQADFIKWANSQKAAYVIEESAIVFENKINHLFDSVILVVADKEERIRRVMKRDKTTREAILTRIGKQLSDKKKIPLANFVIENNKGIDIDKKVLMIHQSLLKK